MRGRLYSSCASSTWSFPSALTACWAKMSRISCVRSIDARVERVLEVALLRRVELVVDEQALGLGCPRSAPSAPRACPCRRTCAAPGGRGAGRRGRPARRPPCARAPRSRRAPSSASAPCASTARTKPRSGSGSSVSRNVESSRRLCPLRSPRTDLAGPDARARRHRVALARGGAALRLRQGARAAASASTTTASRCSTRSAAAGRSSCSRATPTPSPSREHRPAGSRTAAVHGLGATRHEGRPRGDDRARALGRRGRPRVRPRAAVLPARGARARSDNPLPGRVRGGAA